MTSATTVTAAQPESAGSLPKTEPDHSPARRAFSLAEFCRIYGIGTTKAYEEIRAGRLQVRKVGRRTIVPVSAAEAWLSSLPQAV